MAGLNNQVALTWVMNQTSCTTHCVFSFVYQSDELLNTSRQHFRDSIQVSMSKKVNYSLSSALSRELYHR